MPRLLDLFCGAGGAAMGYFRAGFTDITGVDIKPQPRYPFKFMQADALEYLACFWPRFDAIHASPPCQAHSFVSEFNGVKTKHPALIQPTRECLGRLRLPYVIENVVGAPVRRQITLCGTMFNLGVLRHRVFESSMLLLQPSHRQHMNRATPLRKRQKWQPGEYLTVTRHFAYPLRQVQEAMGIDWMRHDEITQAIPPAYTEFIGRQLLRHLSEAS